MGAWDETDADGIANVFRYVFNVSTNVFPASGESTRFYRLKAEMK